MLATPVDLNPLHMPQASGAQTAVAPARQVEPPRRKFGEWSLDVQYDAFRRITNCTLVGPHMSFTHSAVVFRFSRNTQTADAFYSVDQAPSVSWHVNKAQLIFNGLSLRGENPSNPSDGVVAVPWDTLKGARVVAIQLAPHQRPHIFPLGDLDIALSAARESGCNLGPAGADMP